MNTRTAVNVHDGRKQDRQEGPVLSRAVQTDPKSGTTTPKIRLVYHRALQKTSAAFSFALPRERSIFATLGYFQDISNIQSFLLSSTCDQHGAKRRSRVPRPTRQLPIPKTSPSPLKRLGKPQPSNPHQHPLSHTHHHSPRIHHHRTRNRDQRPPQIPHAPRAPRP